jgi:hypothetical protein
MKRTGRNALFSAGVRMENGALGKQFYASILHQSHC